MLLYIIQLFSGVFADDPLFVCEVAQTMSLNVEQQLAKKTQRDRQVAMLACIGKVMDVVTVRHRLIDAAWETEILSKVLLSDLIFKPSHLVASFV